MATFSISLSGSGVVNGSKNWTISDADVQALLNYLEGVYPAPTSQQVLANWAQAFVRRTIEEVKAHQRTQANIPPIVFG